MEESSAKAMAFPALDFVDDSTDQMKNLLERAYSNPLDISQSIILTKLIRENASLCKVIGATGDRLLEMSRFNRSIVVEVLCCQQSHEDFDYYFIDFLQFQVLSLDILEILGAIITRKELSVSQLEHSIGTCISSLEQIRDQSTKDKLVKGICRLCMLLQQSGHLSELRNLGAQMLSFCANNAHVREATTVYAMIKDINQG